MDGPFVVADQAEDVFDRGVAFAEDDTGALGFFAVLDVNVGDALVILGDEGHGRAEVASDEVADVHVGKVELREGEGLFPIFRASGVMAVVADGELVLIREAADALEFGLIVRDLGGEGAGAEGLAELEGVVDLGVAHLEDAIHLDDADEHSGVFVKLAVGRCFAHVCGLAPFAELQSVVLRGLLAFGWLGEFDGGTEEGFDGLGAKLKAADAEFDAVLQHFFSADVVATEVVGDVHADQHAGDFGVRLLSCGEEGA